MDEFRKLLEALITFYKNELLENQELLTNLNANFKIIQDFLTYFTNENYDGIDINILSDFLNDEEKNSQGFKQLCHLKDYFNEYKEESQIKDSKTFLKNHLDKIETKTEKDIANLEEKCKEISDKITYLQKTLEKLEKSEYVDSDTMDFINSEFSDYPETDIIYQLYLKIAKNNLSFLQEKKEEHNPKRETLNLIRKFNSSYFASEFPELVPLISGIIKKFDDITEEDIENANHVNDVSELDLLSSSERLIGTVLFIIKVYNSDLDNKKDIIKESIKIYEQNKEYDYKDETLKLEEYLNAIYEQNTYIIDSLKDAVESFKDFPNDYFEQNENVNFGFNISEFFFVRNYFKCKTQLESIKKNNYLVNTQNREDLEKSIKELEKSLDSYLEYLDKTSNPINTDDNNFNFSKDGDIENYIVFLDLESFKEDFAELMRDHHEIKMSDLYDKLRIVLYASINSIKNQYSATLQYDDKKPNKYGIREIRVGSIRLMYRFLQVSPVDNHKVIMIVGVTYGNTDRINKSAYISQILSNYSVKLEEVKELENLFGKVSTFAELPLEVQDRINEGLDYFQYIKESVESKKNGLGGNSND